MAYDTTTRFNSFQISHSNLKLVTLKNITLKTSGLYKCEILADKSFRTLSDQGYMIVIGKEENFVSL